MTADLAWVVGIDYGYEGKAAPLTWCESEEQAKKAAALLESAWASAYIAAVPKFPDVRKDTP